jgi:DNA-binding HxlR family transcriptional regulator
VGLVIVHFLLDGNKRFSDLQKDIPAISQRMLALNLRKLERVGIVSRKVMRRFPLKIEYQLTREGLALRPVIMALYQWGEMLLDMNRDDITQDDDTDDRKLAES